MTAGFVERPASLLGETLGPALARAAAGHAGRVAVKVPPARRQRLLDEMGRAEPR